MKIHEYIQSKQITFKELDKNFTAVGRQEDGKVGSCGCCGDTLNNRTLPSEPWTIVEYCCNCDSITIRFPSDLMSGCDNKTPSIVFQSKEK